MRRILRKAFDRKHKSWYDTQNINQERLDVSMMQRQEGQRKWSLPMVLLAAAGAMEFLYITAESLFSFIGYYLTEDYLIVPCLLFAGLVLAGKQSPFVRRRLLLSAATVAWFAIVQVIHKLSGMGTHPIGTVFFVYLMAFPFASASEDRENRGMKLIGAIFVAACLVLTGYVLLLILDRVPELLNDSLYWDGTRLHVLWHSNIIACFYMIGIGFAVSVVFCSGKLWLKLFMIAVAVLLFLAMALTNCRTTLLMTCAFFGGTAFFVISQKGGWKRIAAGLAAALVISAGSFWFSGVVFDRNGERIQRNIAAQIQETGEYENLRGKVKVDKETGEIKIVAENGQNSLSNDMRTLNGRTEIWQAALQAIRDNKRIALWGTEDVAPAVSWYHRFPVVHTHNSWMEALMRLGLPGLLLALIYTGIAVRSAWILAWNRHAEIWKKLLAMLTMCVMVAGFLEPYLFITNVYYHTVDFLFFFLVGYLDFWCAQLPGRKTTA